MDYLPLYALAVFGVAILLWPIWFRAETRARRRKDPSYSPPQLMGFLGELYQPDAHANRQLLESQKVVPAPSPVPGDRGPHSGRIVINLDE